MLHVLRKSRTLSREVSGEELHAAQNDVFKAGPLKKKGAILHQWVGRWCVLSGNTLYSYGHEGDSRPKGVMFVAHATIHDLELETESEDLHGFQIVPHTNDQDPKTYYAETTAQKQEWITVLRAAAEVIPFEEEYEIGEELGSGAFAVVKSCIQRKNGRRFAVKIINKENLSDQEKELLRTEIAVLRLVRHPYIVHMFEVFENSSELYMLMEFAKSGTLYDNIVGKARFTEEKARKVMRPLMEGLAYLHDLKIVHRDIKPENILCAEDLYDVKIADFGLSKIIAPSACADTPCGTLSYAAPEVLLGSAHIEEADMWSIGIILFVMLCGNLPYAGEEKNSVLANIRNERMTIRRPDIWEGLSVEARELITGLLTFDSRQRITAHQALNHAWFMFLPHAESDHTIFAESESRRETRTASVRYLSPPDIGGAPRTIFQVASSSAVPPSCQSPSAPEATTDSPSAVALRCDSRNGIPEAVTDGRVESAYVWRAPSAQVHDTDPVLEPVTRVPFAESSSSTSVPARANSALSDHP